MKTLHKTFIEDSTGFLLKLEEILNNFDSEAVNSEEINEAFRLIHSIKSEAAYLGYEEIAVKAHNIESEFDQVRKGNEIHLNIEELFEKVRYIRKSVENIHLTELVEEKTMQIDEAEQAILLSDSDPEIRAFEKQLISEAQDRGEKLYRLVCEIEDDAPLKHPKRYLIVNNLEQLVNVIAYSPSLEKIDNDLAKIHVIFSASIQEKEIYDAVNIDQIKKIQLAELDYSSFLTPREASAAEQNPPEKKGVIRVETETIDKILSYVDEFKIQIHGINKYAGSNKDILPRIRQQIISLKDLTNDMEIILKNVRMVRLSDEFRNYPSFVRELAGKLGKKAEFVMDVGAIRMDRQVIDILSDPITHLIRNAVDHGLEFPDVRIAAGKEAVGTITLSATQEDGQIVIEVTDDGNGINRAAVIKKAVELGILDEHSESADILNILTEPGFSTSTEVTEISGRGVGLDLVFQRIKEFASADFTCTNWPGEGISFSLTLPGEFTVLDIAIMRCGQKTLAVPARNIFKTHEVEAVSFSSGKDGKLLYNNEPVFTIEGRLYESDSLPEEKICIELSHLGKTGFLLADEFLFNQQVPEDQMVLLDEGNPFLYAVTIAGRKTEYMYLNPSMIL